MPVRAGGCIGASMAGARGYQKNPRQRARGSSRDALTTSLIAARVLNKAGTSKENAGRKDPPRAFTVIRRFNRRIGYARTSSQRQDRDVIDDAGIDDLPARREVEARSDRAERSAFVMGGRTSRRPGL